MALAGPTAQQRVVFSGVAGGKQNLYIVGLDGGGLKQLTASPAEDQAPEWTPDGSHIVFTRATGHRKGERRSGGHLWWVRPDGTGLARLTSGPVYDSFSHWSPDGKGLLFYRQGPRHGMYRVDRATKRISEAKVDSAAMRASPDGKRLVYVRGETGSADNRRADLWMAPSSGRKGERLTRFRSGIYPPMWSPDSRLIAFLVEQGSGYRLCVMSIADRRIRTIGQGDHWYFEDPRWSPDGKRLAYIAARQGRSPMTNESFRQLYVVGADGTGTRRLTNHWGNNFAPQWTRDGQSIVIQGQRGMAWEHGGVTGTGISCLIVVDASGKGERLVRTGVPVYSPALGP